MPRPRTPKAASSAARSPFPTGQLRAARGPATPPAPTHARSVRDLDQPLLLDVVVGSLSDDARALVFVLYTLGCLLVGLAIVALLVRTDHLPVSRTSTAPPTESIEMIIDRNPTTVPRT